MLDLIAHNLAPIMFVTVMAMLLIGYPVAFTLAAGGMYFFVVGVELSHISPEIRLFWPLAQANMNRVFDIMRNDTLLAIPFFTFMGLILERSRMAEDLLDTIGQLFGTLRGGLAFAVVVVGALLAATTGVVAASVIAMGLISLPIMMRYNYHPGLAAGTIAASGTLAQIIPPSLVLIVMADQLGRSVGDMYVGAFFPALIIVGMYCAYIFAITLIKPDHGFLPCLRKPVLSATEAARFMSSSAWRSHCSSSAITSCLTIFAMKRGWCGQPSSPP
jgi:tripartite ATP-independent transporter DctM subunit